MSLIHAAHASDADTAPPAMPVSLVVLLATGAGLAVASIYYGAGTSSVWGAGTVITLHLLKNGAQIASLSTGVMSGFTNVNLSSHLSNYVINAGDQFTMTMTRDSGSGSFGVGGGNKPYGLWIIK